MWHIGQIMLGVQNGATVCPDCTHSSLMPDLAHSDWLCQNQRGQGQTILEPVLGTSAHPCTNGKWPLQLSVSGEEDQIVDHIVQRCQYSPPNGIHGLQVLDDDTIKWLSTSCPNI